MFPAFCWPGSPPFRQRLVWGHAALRSCTVVFLPNRGMPLWCAVLDQAQSRCPGRWRCWSALPFYARPGGRAILVQRRNELPAVFLAGPVLNAGLKLCFQLTRKQRTLTDDWLYHRRWAPGGRAFECAGPVVGRCTVRTGAGHLPAFLLPWRGCLSTGPRHAGTRTGFAGAGFVEGEWVRWLESFSSLSAGGCGRWNSSLAGLRLLLVRVTAG